MGRSPKNAINLHEFIGINDVIDADGGYTKYLKTINIIVVYNYLYNLFVIKFKVYEPIIYPKNIMIFEN